MQHQYVTPSAKRKVGQPATPRTARPFNWSALFIATFSAPCGGLAQSQAPAVKAPSIEVISTTPLPGIGAPLTQVPANVQGAMGADMQRQQSLNLPDFLNQNVGSVIINDVQNNPYQPDVLYRGFAASPLLGAAQGLSVYIDGVRINEPFGDVVNWDLIPQSAISSINLIPGSNPLFGLNTLGGTLGIRTKSGEQHPGFKSQGYAGSYGRKAAEFEYGAFKDGFGFYTTGNWFDEEGWRDFSPSKVKQFFAKTGYQTTTTAIDLSLTIANTSLVGNGFTPRQFLEQRRESIYTHFDNTRNGLTFLTLNANHFLTNSMLLAGTVYYRRLKTRTFNGDVNEIADPRFGVIPFEGGPNDLDNGGSGDVGNSASDNRSRVDQGSAGFAFQVSFNNSGKNRFTGGVSHDSADTNFRQTYQLGVLTENRGTLATGPETEFSAIKGTNSTTSVYITDTFALNSATHLTMSARYNITQVKTIDHTQVAFPPPALGLGNDFTYKKLNPAVGLTYNPRENLTLFAGYNQGNRAPTPIELGCSDPNFPCRLPNTMASDPFLKQVIARTVEVGARGKLGGNLDWSAAFYRTDNTDDILFVGTTTSSGYFTNFGKTRRQGIEFGLNGDTGPFSWSANYSYTDATFQSSACLFSENNSTRGQTSECTSAGQDDEILTQPDDRIPGVARNALKLNLDWRASDKWTIGATVAAFSSQYVRGNENNQHNAGTFSDVLGGGPRSFTGPGKVASYATVNLHTAYRIGKGFKLFAKLNNLFDTRYETGGMLGENAFPNGTFNANSSTWVKDTFLSPGPPRMAWIGIRYDLGPNGK